ncbi:S8 family peptidase [Piscinibacter gummiphilus]|uniref:Peptidase S8 n=1 Tax=Piscinibacter gummiphilus TaxID=946333 RepID=A0A1W6LGN3_9BURK|nr:S8 family peptidase [Piscinibacter gummiphilus]ARN23415.1 peptidase S8 [Piscinibacter gummiphilus]ATU68125.1 peptidase S8 [Piscinibacter gummiphilus]GLS97434.1 extracellular protease [Piscinibacter gummiphilus]
MRQTSRLLAGLALALAAVAPGATFAGGADAARATDDDGTDRLIIRYRPGVPGAARSAPAAERTRLHRGAEAAAARFGRRLQWVRVGAFDTHVMRLDGRVGRDEAVRLSNEIARSDSSVEYAEPDRILHALATPNDTQYGQQWHYFEARGGLNLPSAWDKSTGAGVVVAVIDTGYRPHADLAANVLPGYDFIKDSGNANDGNARDSNAQDPGDYATAGACGFLSPIRDTTSSWHGTHVAGTIAAVSNNGTGVAGVAYRAKVLPVRVLGRCGGYTSDIADGIVWAAGGSVSGVPANPTPARVINLSLGGSGGCDTTSQNAVNLARSRGTVVVVAAGNSNADASGFSPASCNGVIAVAATNRNGGRASYSNYGAKVSVAAPGGDTSSGAANGILSTLNSGTRGPGSDSYAYYQGTSMASPHVAGVVALMLSRNPALTPDEVASRLKSSARAFPATCSGCGSGLVDANAAVDAAGGSTPPAGTPDVEPNNTVATAQSAREGDTIAGTLSATSDVDVFAVPIKAGSTLGAKLTPNAAANFDVAILSASGTTLASSSNTGLGVLDATSYKNTGTVTTTYYVRVKYTGGSAGAYQLVID